MKLVNKSLLTLFLLLLLLTWKKWGYLVGDLGRELYTPTRILAGQLPYKDFVWNYGPVPLYVTSTLYQAGGIHTNVYAFETILIAFVILILCFDIAKKLNLNRVQQLLIGLMLLSISFFGTTYQSLIMTGKLASAIGVLLWFVALDLLLIPKLRWRTLILGLLLGISSGVKQEVFASILLLILGDFYFQKEKLVEYVKVLLIALVVGLIIYGSLLVGGVGLENIYINLFPKAAGIWFPLQMRELILNWKRYLLPFIALMLSLAVMVIDKKRFWFLLMLTGLVASYPFLLLYVITDLPKTVGWLILILSLIFIKKLILEKQHLAQLISILPFLAREAGFTSGYTIPVTIFLFVKLLSFILPSKFIKISIFFGLLLLAHLSYSYISDYYPKQMSFETKGVSLIVNQSHGRVVLETVKNIDSIGSSGLLSIPLEAIINFASNIKNPTKSEQWIIGLPTLTKSLGQTLSELPDVVAISNYDFYGTTGLGDTKEVSEFVANNYQLLWTIGPYFDSLPVRLKKIDSNYQIKVYAKKAEKER